MDAAEDAARARDDFLQDMRIHLEAAGRLRSDLKTHEEVSRRIMEAVKHGNPLLETLREEESATWRPKLSDSIRTFERLRHRARLRLISIGLAEGMTVQEVACEWGITRQLAARYVKEIEALDASTPTKSS